MNTSDCPNADAILAHARYRGLDDASLEYEFPFGWHLVSSNTAEDGGGCSLLSNVIDEMCIAYGGTHGGRAQIAPEKYVEPWSQWPHGPGLPLHGYVGCRVSGERRNSKKHPCCGIETVDTLSFLTRTRAETAEAVEHFTTIGYLNAIDGTCGDMFGAVLFIPKLSNAVRQHRDASLLIGEIGSCLDADLKRGGAYLPRLAAAVLGSTPCALRTPSDIRTAISTALTLTS